MPTHHLTDDGVRVRLRTHAATRLPRFDADGELTADVAQFDKMVFARVYTLSNVPVPYFGPIELAHRLTEELRQIVTDEMLDIRCSALRTYSRGATSGEADVSPDYRRCTGGERWLFKPEIEFRFADLADRRALRTQEEAGHPPVRLHVAVTLSPARISAHAMERGIDVHTAPWCDILFSDQATVDRVAQYSTKHGDDNVLPARAFVEPRSLDEVIAKTERYVVAFEAFLEHLVGCPVRSSRPEGPWLAPASHGWTVRQAETFWEFGQVGAIEFVTRLRPVLWSIAGRMRERSWSNDDDEEMVGYTMRATKQIRIALYAKTIDRIRLEVRNTSGAYGNASDALSGRLLGIAEAATDRANQARAAILTRLEEVDPSPTLSENVNALRELVCTLASAYRDDPERAGDILRELLVRGGLRTRGDEFLTNTAEARRLVHLHVVETTRFAQASRTENFYPISTRYYPLFEKFQGRHAASERSPEASDEV